MVIHTGKPPEFPRNFKFQNPFSRVPLGLVLGLAALVILAFFVVRVGRVTASEVGVLVNNLNGDVEIIPEPGSFFYNSLTSDLYTVDKTVHTLKMMTNTGDEVRIKTRDGSDVRLDVEVNYSLLLDVKVLKERMVKETGVKKVRVFNPVAGSDRRRRRRSYVLEEAWQAKWIRDYSRAVIRYVFGSLETETFYDAAKREEKARESERELNKLLNPHGIRVTKVIPDRFRFYDEYEKAIRDKKEADQEVEKQKALARAAIEKQGKEIVLIEKKAEVEIAKIKGELQEQILEAEGRVLQVKRAAEAYAYRRKVEADASFYQAERAAKGILVAAEAEAKALSNMVAALDGEGGRNLVLRALAERLRTAQIEGQPYATSPLIQKLQLEGSQKTSKAIQIPKMVGGGR
jgi:regulator of protease activity HflC (stomatin/prohibitin superfamily)